MKTNSYITEEDVKKGKCGKIIPENMKNPDYSIYGVYEFYNKDEHGTRDNYKKHYPGFAKQNTDNGHCIPCCYKIKGTLANEKKVKECKKTQES